MRQLVQVAEIVLTLSVAYYNPAIGICLGLFAVVGAIRDHQ